MANKLEAAIAGGATKPPVASRLEAALSGVRPWQPIVVPMLNLEAAFVLVGVDRMIEIEAETTRAMEARRLDQSTLTLTPWELERCKRILAEAVVELDHEKKADAPPLGSVATWGKLSPAVIVELRRMYEDFAEEHDPSLFTLDPDERTAIADAVKKKEPIALRRFGARRLADWLTSTDGLLADSSATKSSPGDSSPAS